MARSPDFPTPHRLYRDPRRAVVLGVCSGLADYFNIETFLIRCGAVIGLMFFLAPTVLGYFLLGFMLPRRPDALFGSAEEEGFRRSMRVHPGMSLAAAKDRFRELDQRLAQIEAHVTTREFQLDRQIRELERGF